jgi:transcriptional regulator with XRE-family HTH domain
MKSKKATASGVQILGARSMLKLSRAQLAEATGIGTTTLYRIESGEGRHLLDTVAKVQAELERLGAEFGEPNWVNLTERER